MYISMSVFLGYIVCIYIHYIYIQYNLKAHKSTMAMQCLNDRSPEKLISLMLEFIWPQRPTFTRF